MIVLINGHDGVVLCKTQLWYHSIITSFVHVARYFMCKCQNLDIKPWQQ